MTPGLRYLKGHGTQNDFIVLPDPDGLIDLTPALVRRLCDRRAGLGADGVLRVVPCAVEPAAAPYADQAHWFMDYRNADGSVAEMCGNGVRVSGIRRHGQRMVGEVASERDGLLEGVCAAPGQHHAIARFEMSE